MNKFQKNHRYAQDFHFSSVAKSVLIGGLEGGESYGKK